MDPDVSFKETKSLVCPFCGDVNITPLDPWLDSTPGFSICLFLFIPKMGL